MIDRIDEKDLPRVSPAPTAHLRAVQGGKSVLVPLPDVANASALVADAIIDIEAAGRAQMAAAVANVADEAMDVVEQAGRDASALLADTQTQVDAVLSGMGYLPPVEFAAGIVVESSRFTVAYDGATYAPVVDALPFTTSGTFDPSQWRLVQGVSGADLAAPTGAATVGFKQAGDGAVARTLQAKAREIVSFNDFGAVGDGVSDDSAAILRAVNYAVSNGAILVGVPGANYKCSGSMPLVTGDLRVDGRGCKFTGAGTNSIFKVDGSVDMRNMQAESCLLLDLNGLTATHDALVLDNIEVTDSQIVHAQPASTETYHGFRYVALRNLIQDNDGYAARFGIYLFIRRMWNVVVDGVNVYNALRRGILVGQNSEYNTCDIRSVSVQGCYVRKVRDTDGSPESQGIEVNDSESTRILGNTVEDVAFASSVPNTGCEGIYIRGGQDGYVIGNTLRNAGGGQGSILLKCRGHGVVAYNSVKTTDVRGIFGISAYKSRHLVIYNRVEIHGTPSGMESRGVWLAYEDAAGDAVYQDTGVFGNQIYFGGNGTGGLEIGIDAFFGNLADGTGFNCDWNIVVGASSAPIKYGIKLSNGGAGANIGPNNRVENADTGIDVFTNNTLDQLTVRGTFSNVAKVLFLRGSAVPKIKRLRVEGVRVNNTSSSLSSASLLTCDGIGDEIESMNCQFDGYYLRVYDAFGGAVFKSTSDVCRPQSAAPRFFRIFDQNPEVVKIFNGDFRGMDRLVAIDNAGGLIGMLWQWGNDLTGVTPTTVGVASINSGNNLGVEVT